MIVYLRSRSWTKVELQDQTVAPSVAQSKGQVSIFLVFLFQILFVFFAMVINVGMLVYYKINLQNSVDLAAYYAAMKQAEMLNTIGHVNYQIRQSWKLLTYRANILGTLGPDNHPARPNPPGNFKAYPNERQYVIVDSSGVAQPVVPVFCVTIAEIYANSLGLNGVEVNTKDNQCRNFGESTLGGFKIPPVIWALPGFNETIRQGAINLQDRFLNEFSGGGFRNFRTLAAFITFFRADSLNRRKVIGVLANSMSKNSQNFLDIEGKGVFEGAQKVLQKNLASENNSGLSSTLLNSLAHPGCGGVSSDVEALPGWLKEIEIFATFPYLDSQRDSLNSDASVTASQRIRCIGMPCIPYPSGNSLKDTLPYEVGSLSTVEQDAFNIVGSLLNSSGIPQHPAGRWTTAVGVEKNPWCMPYVGFKASSRPRLPFMPQRLALTLEAKAFAKPFGSRIGPWYGKTWSSKGPNTTSDQNLGARTDSLLPARMLEGATSLPVLGPNAILSYIANFSRFVGDTLGVLSEGMRWGYGTQYWMADMINAYRTGAWVVPFLRALDNNGGDNSKFFMGPPSGDIMADAYDNQIFIPAANPSQAKAYAALMRRTELAAIAPDLFDATYYSIEPRFNEYLLPRLQAFVNQENTKRPDLLVRGDLGWRSPSDPGEAKVADTSANVAMHIQVFKDSFFYKKRSDALFHTVSDPAHLLTSWAEKSIVDYGPANSADKISQCTGKIPEDSDLWAPGGCTIGGRIGYSVKLVSKKFLNSEIPDLGGSGISGLILNPPESDF